MALLGVLLMALSLLTAMKKGTSPFLLGSFISVLAIVVCYFFSLNPWNVVSAQSHASLLLTRSSFQFYAAFLEPMLVCSASRFGTHFPLLLVLLKR